MNDNASRPQLDPTRRRWLQALAAAPVAVGASSTPLPAQAAVKTSARIVIAGSGLGGLAVANRLAGLLDGAKITLIDRKEAHNYQPGYTLVASASATTSWWWPPACTSTLHRSKAWTSLPSAAKG
jgi:hypothetical protein